LDFTTNVLPSFQLCALFLGAPEEIQMNKCRKGPTEVVTARVLVPVMDEIRKLADERDRSIAWIAAQLLQAGIEATENGTKLATK
jgi:hypothetical protein